MKLLFISHTYPPIAGGVESQNYELYTWLSKHVEVRLVANQKRWMIPFFLIYATFLALFSARRYDAIILGSCLLGNVGWVVKKFTQTPTIAVAHGLDLTWKNKLYQALWVGRFIPALDKLIAVGNETIRAGVERGIAPEKFVFIPNGIDANKFYKPMGRRELETFLGETLEGKKVILTSGRLAKRKGVAWFISEVVPKLDKNILYVVAGDGPDRKNILTAIEKNNLQNRVRVLGYVTDENRDALLNTCDLFVQPNIKVAGDMEGFGISVIEAASCRIPVLASKLEGLQDAIKDGKNGFLIESGNTDAWISKVNELLAINNLRREFGEKARQYVVENYSWERISKKYLEEIKKVIKK